MKRWLKAIIIAAAVIIVVFLGISIYLGYSMTRVERVAVEGSPADAGMEYEGVSFKSREDALTLYGWFLPSGGSDKVIIMVHGADGNRNDTSIGTLELAAGLVHHGYNVLMFDLRGHGESEGERMSAGYHEQKDLLGATDFIKQRGYEKIGVLGFSMGAAAAVLTAADSTDIDCIISDSCFADITEIMQREFSTRTRFPGFFLRPVLFAVKIIYGVDFPAVRPVEVAARITPRPIFFIHGEGDTFLPPEHAGRLLEASGNPANEIWIAPGAEHVQSYATHPAEYIRRITEFLDKTLE